LHSLKAVITIKGIAGECFATEEMLETFGTAEGTGDVHLLPCWDAYVRRIATGAVTRPGSQPVRDRLGRQRDNVILARWTRRGHLDLEKNCILYFAFEPIPKRSSGEPRRKPWRRYMCR